MKIFCVVPAFNEKGNISDLITRICTVCHKNNIAIKILLVIQGNDGSKEIVENLKKKYPELQYIYYPSPLGIGKAYQKGFSEVDRNYPFVLTMDADLNHEPEQIPHFVHTMKKHKLDLLIGSRFIKGGSFPENRIWKKISSMLINTLITKLYHINVHDISSGYRLIKTPLIKTILPKLIESGYPSYMEFMIHAKREGAKIGETPIKYVPRVWGKSKMGKAKTASDYLIFLSRLPFIS